MIEPRTAELESMTLAGLSRQHPAGDVSGLQVQWQSFAEVLPTLCNDSKPVTFGVFYNRAEDSFDYLTGIADQQCTGKGDEIVQLELSARTYLVFDHPGHVSSVPETVAAIWSEWLPNSAIKVVEAPWFERYGESFDPLTGNGGLELWIPIER